MNNYKGPKLKLSRRLSVPIADTPKHSLVLEKRKRPWGKRRRKPRSIYGLQLDEKQKIAFYYNIGNKQILRYLDIAKKTRSSTADALIEIIETRLDNVVRRLGWARTVWQARQLVAHGHIAVNGRKVDRPGYQVAANDTITPRESSKKVVGNCAASAVNIGVPSWLTVDQEKFEGKVVGAPKIEDVQLPFSLNTSMIIEFFSK